MPAQNFEYDAELTAIAVAYKNDKANYIADKVCPITPVEAVSFKYNEYPMEEGFTVPDLRVGRSSETTTIDYSKTEKSASCEDFAVQGFVYKYDEDRAPKNYSPRKRVTEGTADLVLLAHEIRTAKLVRNPSNYLNKKTLTGSAQFSDAASHPREILLEAISSMLMTPNTMVLGMDVWTKLRIHPEIVKAAHGNSGDSGIVSRQAFADLFEIPNLVIGNARYNTVNKGQSAVLEPCWSKVLSLLYINENADTQNGMTWGMTAAYGDKETHTFFDPNKGRKGAEVIRVGESKKELVIAPGCGYLIENPIA